VSEQVEMGMAALLADLRSRVRALDRMETWRGWRLISETVLTGSVASVTFSSVPDDYRMLALAMQTCSDRVAESDNIMWRAGTGGGAVDSGNNYDYLYWNATGGNVQSSGASRAISAGSCGYSEAASSRASNFAPTICYWPGYALTDREKWSNPMHSARFGDVSADADMYTSHWVSRWRNTGAITSIQVYPLVGPNFVSGSRFTLYGVR